MSGTIQKLLELVLGGMVVIAICAVMAVALSGIIALLLVLAVMGSVLIFLAPFLGNTLIACTLALYEAFDLAASPLTIARLLAAHYPLFALAFWPIALLFVLSLAGVFVTSLGVLTLPALPLTIGSLSLLIGVPLGLVTGLHPQPFLTPGGGPIAHALEMLGIDV